MRWFYLFFYSLKEGEISVLILVQSYVLCFSAFEGSSGKETQYIHATCGKTLIFLLVRRSPFIGNSSLGEKSQITSVCATETCSKEWNQECTIRYFDTFQPRRNFRWKHSILRGEKSPVANHHHKTDNPQTPDAHIRCAPNTHLRRNYEKKLTFLQDALWAVYSTREINVGRTMLLASDVTKIY